MQTSLDLRGGGVKCYSDCERTGRGDGERGDAMPAPLDDVAAAADRLRSAEQEVTAARERLAEAILTARDAGESLSAIGRAAAVSRQWVAFVVQNRQQQR